MITGIAVDGSKMNTLYRARVWGMVYVLTGYPENMWDWQKNLTNDTYYLPIECTEKQLNQIKNAVEKLYPGMTIA